MQGGKIRTIFNLSSNYLLMQLYLNTILKILCLHVKKQRFAIYTQLSCGPTTEIVGAPHQPKNVNSRHP